MAGQMNCWEFKKCERHQGGRFAGQMGICPAFLDESLNGIHGGRNAGRACWVVAGTFCGGRVQGTEAQKQQTCWRCDFIQQVKQEEEQAAHGFSITALGMRKVLEKLKP